ncbi:MAG TPA: alkaline phosphatase PhoX [Ilumatobacteraceae bacterium]|nr:alkaline phosphatase PhoX [Ilumatobacteraceae bacterium]
MSALDSQHGSSAMDRRSFIRRSAIAAAAGAVGAGPFQGFIGAATASAGKPGAVDYGPLVPVPDARDGVVRLELPRGFNYRSFQMAGSPMASSTSALPGRHDGMAAFAGPRANQYRLVRNHEINGPGSPIGLGPAYDSNAQGGCVSVVVDRHGKVASDVVSLNGTQMNCAGGAMPWQSWVSCEETVNGPDVFDDFTRGSAAATTYVRNAQLQQPHGYIFEVPANGTSNLVPIRSAGRFAHEAAVADPNTGQIYMTEDNFGFPSGFYRYDPPNNPVSDGRIADGGRLWMLAVTGVSNADLSLGQAPGASHSVQWVEIDEPDPTFRMEGGLPTVTNDEAITAVGDQGRAEGAALFSRLEGAYYDRGRVYFVSTQGGAQNPGDSAPAGFGNGRGQVWAYDTASSMLHLVYESPAAATLDLPDNVVASRSGTLILCEDGSGDNFLRGLTPGGEIFDFARNADPDQVGQEVAGATF